MAPDPAVSIIVANFNGEKYIADALSSAINQTMREIEVIFVDDASSDTSVEVAKRFASRDDRVRIIARKSQSGPGAARNDALAVARGKWIAILDSDDMMHPSRIASLVSEAERSNADICADDLLIFQDATSPTTHLSRRQRQIRWVKAEDFIDRIYGREPSLGYVKPLIRTSFLRRHDIRYNADLLIGEDYDLIMQLLAHGARFRLLDSLGYFYRKHSNSISHRMSGGNLEQLLIGDRRLRSLFGEGDKRVTEAFEARRASIERALAYGAIVSAMKTRRWKEAFAVAVRSPGAIPLLAMPLAARLRRLTAPKATHAPSRERHVCIVSRQHLMGDTGDSDGHLIAIARTLSNEGHTVNLVAPTPSVLGRALYLRLPPEMDAFDEVHIRGAWRIGRRLFVAPIPQSALTSAYAAVTGMLSFFGRGTSSTSSASAHCSDADGSREDQLYVAKRAPRNSRLLLADDTSTISCLPYALVPSARKAVVVRAFASQANGPSPLPRSSDADVQLLRQVDTIVATRKSDAAELQRLLTDRQILVAIMDEPSFHFSWGAVAAT